jgi:hypothetical protein
VSFTRFPATVAAVQVGSSSRRRQRDPVSCCGLIRACLRSPWAAAPPFSSTGLLPWSRVRAMRAGFRDGERLRSAAIASGDSPGGCHSASLPIPQDAPLNCSVPAQGQAHGALGSLAFVACQRRVCASVPALERSQVTLLQLLGDSRSLPLEDPSREDTDPDIRRGGDRNALGAHGLDRPRSRRIDHPSTREREQRR